MRRYSSWLHSSGKAEISANWKANSHANLKEPVMEGGKQSGMEGDTNVVRTFRNSFYGANSNSEDGGNSDKMEDDFLEVGSNKDMSLNEELELGKLYDKKKRQSIITKTHPTSIVSSTVDSIDGTKSSFTKSKKQISVVHGVQDGRKP